MSFQVFDSDKPADSTGYPYLKAECWKNSKYDTFEEAKQYATWWLGAVYEGLTPQEPDVKVVYYTGCTIEIRTIENHHANQNL